MTRMKFAAVAVSVILLVSVASNIYLYVSANNRNNEPQAQIEELTGQIVVLQRQNDALQTIRGILQIRIDDLTKLLDIESPSYLITSLGSTDVRTPSMMNLDTFPNSRLYIEGTVTNTGTETAYNCRLTVTLYRGNSVVNNTIMSLGTMKGGAIVGVSENIPYSGDPLTKWTIIPKWD